MKTEEIILRDPFIVPFEGKYYMYGSNSKTCFSKINGDFPMYVSEDLKEWEGPFTVFNGVSGFWGKGNYWAAKVYRYDRRFYLFCSFIDKDEQRSVAVLCSDTPAGPFVPLVNHPLTPSDWTCLDGVLYVDKDNNPNLVFCHEWVQITNGTICTLKLSKDLKEPLSDPEVLLDGKSAPWANKNAETWVTDAPSFYRGENGDLYMIWSSNTKTETRESAYVMGYAKSESGELKGPWVHGENLLFSEHGGAGIAFKTFEGKPLCSLHCTNENGFEHVFIYELIEKEGKLFLGKKYNG